MSDNENDGGFGSFPGSDAPKSVAAQRYLMNKISSSAKSFAQGAKLPEVAAPVVEVNEPAYNEDGDFEGGFGVSEPEDP